MSAISQIRSLIQDTPLYAKEEITLDGEEISFQLMFFPVVESSVIITPEDDTRTFTVDEDNGLVTFDDVPTSSPLIVEYKHVLLLDSTIQDFIDIEGSDADVRLAAADALDAIASSQALIQKKIKLLDLETDGPAIAEALRAHAKSLRDLVLAADMTESTFDIAEQINDEYGFSEKVWKDWMRSA